MIEYDEHGKEWFGYSFGGDETDPQSVVNAFTGNVQYAEWCFRQMGNAGQRSLATQLNFLFDLLPPECVSAVTNHRPALIAEIVRVTNRFAHGKYEESPTPVARLHTLSIKVAALLNFAERINEGDVAFALSMAERGSPYLRQQLGTSDIAHITAVLTTE